MVHDHLVRRDVEVPLGAAANRRHIYAILWNDVFGIEIERHLDLIADFFANRVVVQVESNLRPGLHEFAGVRPIDVAEFPYRPLAEVDPARRRALGQRSDRIGVVGLKQKDIGVVDDLMAEVRWPCFDRSPTDLQ